MVTAILIGILIVTFLGCTLELVAGAGNSANNEINFPVPEWQFNITGFVNNQLNLSLTDLVAMPQTTENAVLRCVGNPSVTLAYGNWTGVSLKFLLEQAEVSPGAAKVAFLASDGFTTDLPLATAMDGNVILAYELNGAPLNETIRLVVPGEWGYKWICQVTNIKLVNFDFLGRYESSGYPDQATVILNEYPSGQWWTPPALPPIVTSNPSLISNLTASSPSPEITSTPIPTPGQTQLPTKEPTQSPSLELTPSPSFPAPPEPISSPKSYLVLNSSSETFYALISGAALTAIVVLAILVIRKKTGTTRKKRIDENQSGEPPK